MRVLVLAAALASTPSLAGAQAPSWFPPPGPGTPVDFVACPERTAGGSWVATDGASGYTYSLAGAVPPPPNLVVRVSGIVSPDLAPVPGWLLSPVKVVVGRQPCPSRGVLPPGSVGFTPFVGLPPASLPGQ